MLSGMLQFFSEAYLEPIQTCKLELYVKIANS